MFGGKFSHTRFSLRNTESVLAREVFESYTANLSVFITFASVFQGNEVYSANMLTKFLIVPGLASSEKYTAGLTVKALGAIAYIEKYIAELYGNAGITADYNVLEEYAAELDSGVSVAANYNAPEEYAANLVTKTTVNANINSGETYTATMFAIIDIDLLDSDMFVINVSIPPGGELRIDSAEFTVTLNGANIIHLHEGDFVNIDRDTINMLISSGGGNLTGQLIYIERYL